MANNIAVRDSAGVSKTVKTTDSAGVHTPHHNVDTLPALPAGTNNIGDVDIASIAAGDNNIGNVDIVTLPGTVATDITAVKTAIEIIDNAIAGTEMQVDVITLPTLPAGDNNIGNVDVVTLPALSAGDNNIGNVDVVTLPTLPAGDNNIGNVDIVTLPGTVAADITAVKTAVEIIDNAIAGSEMQVDVITLPAIPAGNNNIGDVDIASIAAGDNNIGNVDVVTLPTLPAGDNNIGNVDIVTLPGTVATDITAVKTAIEIIDNAIAGSEMQVDVITLPALPAGNNNIGDVDVASITAGENHIGEVAGNMSVVSVELTRPADTNAYTAGDVVANSTSAATVLTFTNLMRVNAGTGYIVRASITTDKKSITPRFRVHMFNASNPTFANDNVAYKELYADASKRLGYFDMVAMTTAVDTTNSDMSRTQDNTIRFPVFAAAATRTLYCLLETLDAFTPASGQKFTVRLCVENN